MKDKIRVIYYFTPAGPFVWVPRCPLGPSVTCGLPKDWTATRILETYTLGPERAQARAQARQEGNRLPTH